MTDEPKDKPNRPGRPNASKHHRGRRPKSTPQGTLAFIDRLLMARMRVTLNGRTRLIPTLAAIVLQLMQKDLAGDSRAGSVLLKYEKLARTNDKKGLGIKFMDSDYTRAFGNWQQEDDND